MEDTTLKQLQEYILECANMPFLIPQDGVEIPAALRTFHKWRIENKIGFQKPR